MITTKGTENDKLISQELAEFPPDVVKSIDYTLPSPVPVQVGFEVSMLLHDDPRYTQYKLIESVKTLMSGCAQDSKLCRLLISWFKSTRDPVTTVSQLVALPEPPSPQMVFGRILADIPEDRHSWAQKLLGWIISAVRPLRTYEFCLVSTLSQNEKGHTDDFIYRGNPQIRHHLASLLQHFGGMLSVVHDEIQFSHPLIRNWLVAEEPPSKTVVPWYRKKTEQDRQVEILKSCLEHIRDDKAPEDVWPAKLPYAIQFWTHHYQLAGPVESVLDTIFRHQPTFERWMNAYNSLPSPFTKPLRLHIAPLPIAAHFGLKDIVGSLLSNGVLDRETRGEALIEASRSSPSPALDLIIEAYSPELHFDDRYLHDAVKAAFRRGDPSSFRKLVNLIPEPPHTKPQWMTPPGQELKDRETPDQPVEGAGASGDSLNSEDPGNRSADVESSNTETGSPDTEDPFLWLSPVISRAAWLGLEDVVERLLSLGANPNRSKAEEDCQTPLHEAANNYQLGTAKVLVKAGADLTAVCGSKSETPLHTAASFGAADVAKFLLEQGAAIDSKDTQQWTPLQAACEWGHYTTAEVILKHRKFQEYLPLGSVGQPIVLSTQMGRTKIIKHLFDHGADPNVSDPTGETALWHAVGADRIDLCKLLLENNADPNFTPSNAVPPLIKAVMEGNLEIVQLLVEKGADLEKTEMPGNGWLRTPRSFIQFLPS